MSIFDNLETGNDIEQEKDSLGGRQILESDAYLLTIKLAYLTQSEGGANALNLVAETEAGTEFRSSMYFTSGREKGGKNFYTDAKGEKKYLPGYNMANSLSELTTGKDFVTTAKETAEEKVINLYNKEAKAEVPTKVQMVMGLVGVQVYAGILKQLEDKTQETAQGSKEYVPTGETRESNEIDKFFCAREGYEKKTSAEIRGKSESAVFFDQWVAKWKGKTKDKTSKDAGKAGALKPKAAGAAAGTKPTNSLFG
jgi:hypothetical protein